VASCFSKWCRRGIQCNCWRVIPPRCSVGLLRLIILQVGGWQLENNITYSKLDVTAGTNKTLGIIFLNMDKDVAVGWYVWPSTASISKPSTWGDMTPNGYDWILEFPHGHRCFFCLLCLQLP